MGVSDIGGDATAIVRTPVRDRMYEPRTRLLVVAMVLSGGKFPNPERVGTWCTCGRIQDAFVPTRRIRKEAHARVEAMFTAIRASSVIVGRYYFSRYALTC